ncbi:MAG: hypothetical protein H0U27_11235, partial [Nitrosopumilus sp.]|nr:hypothetical protein [Nitrosopumilus sp.]
MQKGILQYSLKDVMWHQDQFLLYASFPSNAISFIINNDTLRGSYIAKFDTLGNYLWSKDFLVNIADVKTGNDDKIYITGEFKDTLTIGSQSIISSGNSDAIILILDANGNYLTHIHGKNKLDSYFSGIAIDEYNNIWTLISYGDTLDIAGTILTDTIFLPSVFSKGGTKLIKLNSTGQVLWVNPITHMMGGFVTEGKDYVFYTAGSHSSPWHSGSGLYKVSKDTVNYTLKSSEVVTPWTGDIYPLISDSLDNLYFISRWGSQYSNGTYLKKIDKNLQQLVSFPHETYADRIWTIDLSSDSDMKFYVIHNNRPFVSPPVLHKTYPLSLFNYITIGVYNDNLEWSWIREIPGIFNAPYILAKDSTIIYVVGSYFNQQLLGNDTLPDPGQGNEN